LQTDTGSCATGPVVFNKFIDNLKIHEFSQLALNCKIPATTWINLPECLFASGVCGIMSNPSGKFLKLAVAVTKGKCNRVRKDNVGVALNSGAKFLANTPYKIRYKIHRKTADLTGFPIPQGCAFLFNLSKLRFFGSKKGPTNWLDNNNTIQELSNANFEAGATLIGCNFQLVERNITFNSNEFTTLALLAESGGVFIDDVEVFLACDDYFIVQNKKYDFNTYAPLAIEGSNFKEEAGLTLIAGENVGGINGIGDVVVESGSYVIYTASSDIILKEGFSVQLGSNFHAIIAPCPNNISNKLVDNNKIGSPVDFFGDDSEISNRSEEIFEQNEEFITAKIFPNPTTNIFTYQTEINLQNSTFKINNVLNQLVFTKTILTESVEVNFDISELPAGIYFLNHYNNSGTLISINKIIKN